MTRRQLLDLAGQLLRIPTAPYHEQGIARFIREFCHRHALPVATDGAGNLFVRYGRGGAAAPLTLVAHMDHPGFEARGGRRAEFLGGVPPECFPGAKVRFHTASGIVRARVQRVDRRQWPRRKFLELAAGPALQPGDFGMWDLPLFKVKGDRLTATAIDDVLSVAVTLATLAELKRRQIATHVWGVFTRAEEVGFPGAIAVARQGTIPSTALVVSLEMSRERPWARIGQGPVIRVGDKASVFDGLAAFFFAEVAAALQQRDPRFQFQRALMDGGTCEATAFGGFGYRVLGLCLPLGNYHNIGPGRRPRAEHVSIRDLQGLLRLTLAVAERWREFPRAAALLRRRVRRIEREAPRRLLGAS